MLFSTQTLICQTDYRWEKPSFLNFKSHFFRLSTSKPFNNSLNFQCFDVENMLRSVSLLSNAKDDSTSLETASATNIRGVFVPIERRELTDSNELSLGKQLSQSIFLKNADPPFRISLKVFFSGTFHLVGKCDEKTGFVLISQFIREMTGQRCTSPLVFRTVMANAIRDFGFPINQMALFHIFQSDFPQFFVYTNVITNGLMCKIVVDRETTPSFFYQTEARWLDDEQTKMTLTTSEIQTVKPSGSCGSLKQTKMTAQMRIVTFLIYSSGKHVISGPNIATIDYFSKEFGKIMEIYRKRREQEHDSFIGKLNSYFNFPIEGRNIQEQPHRTPMDQNKKTLSVANLCTFVKPEEFRKSRIKSESSRTSFQKMELDQLTSTECDFNDSIFSNVNRDPHLSLSKELKPISTGNNNRKKAALFSCNFPIPKKYRSRLLSLSPHWKVSGRDTILSRVTSSSCDSFDQSWAFLKVFCGSPIYIADQKKRFSEQNSGRTELELKVESRQVVKRYLKVLSSSEFQKNIKVFNHNVFFRKDVLTIDHLVSLLNLVAGCRRKRKLLKH